MSIMDIKVLGFNFRLEILLIGLFIYFILSAHLVCSCMRLEGFRGNKGNKNRSDYDRKYEEGSKRREREEDDEMRMRKANFLKNKAF